MVFHWESLRDDLKENEENNDLKVSEENEENNDLNDLKEFNDQFDHQVQGLEIWSRQTIFQMLLI